MKNIPKEAFRSQIMALIPVYLNVFMVGCGVGWTPNAIYFMKKGDEITATIAESGLIISCSDIGRTLMAIPAGILMDQFGRKNTVLIVVILHFIGWVALSVKSNLMTICVARFIIGVAMAFVNASVMICIGEFASPEIRAKLIAVYQQCLSIGYIFPVLISLSFNSYFKLSYCTLAICCLNFLILYWVLETPNYLISRSQNENALKILKHIRRGYREEEINSEFDKMKKYIQNEKKRKSDTNWFKFVKSKEIRRPLIISFLIHFFVIACGFNVLNIYTTVLIPKNEIISEQYYLAVIFGCNLITSLVLPLYIEKFSRRMLFMSGSVGLALCYVVLTVSYVCYSVYEDQVSKWIFILGFVVALTIMSGSTLPMMNALKAEILPQSVKGFGCSLCVMAQSLANIIVVSVFNIIMLNFGLYYNFLIYGANSLILFFLVYFYMPESRGKLLSDIQMEINDKQSKMIV